MANPHLTIETNLGTIEAELFMDRAPITAGNFLKLVQKGFYNGLIFHRVIDGFMIQGGCPQGTGYGGPGYTIKDEFGAGLSHEGPGIFSMANAGKDTGGSQFFITLASQHRLDGKHAVFGKVTGGLDVVQKIGKTPVDRDDRPRTPVKMVRVSVTP